VAAGIVEVGVSGRCVALRRRNGGRQ
jgi:hypothetical protein